MLDVLESKTKKANKDHICQFCGILIKKGEKYNHQTCKYDDRLYTWKSHLKCYELTGLLDMGSLCDDGIDMQSFCDIIVDEFCERFSLEEMINILYEKVKIK